MKTTVRAIIAAIIAATPAYAATEGEAGLGLLTMAFIGFAALIVAFQLVPALTLFFGMVKGLFAAAPKTLDAGTKDVRL